LCLKEIIEEVRMSLKREYMRGGEGRGYKFSWRGFGLNKIHQKIINESIHMKSKRFFEIKRLEK